MFVFFSFRITLTYFDSWIVFFDEFWMTKLNSQCRFANTTRSEYDYFIFFHSYGLPNAFDCCCCFRSIKTSWSSSIIDKNLTYLIKIGEKEKERNEQSRREKIRWQNGEKSSDHLFAFCCTFFSLVSLSTLLLSILTYLIVRD